MQYQGYAQRFESESGELGTFGGRRRGQSRTAHVRESDAAAFENAAAFDDRGHPVTGKRLACWLAPGIGAQPQAVLAFDFFNRSDRSACNCVSDSALIKRRNANIGWAKSWAIARYMLVRLFSS